MMKKNILILIAATALWAQPALAANNVFLQLIAMEEVTVVNDAGNKTTKLVEPKSVEPDDVVVYTINYDNRGKTAAENIVINDPIPSDTVYIADSAVGKGTTIVFSVDGKVFAAADKLMVKGEDGKMRLARVNEYRHVRWTLKKDLAAGKKGSVSFKARVK